VTPEYQTVDEDATTFWTAIQVSAQLSQQQHDEVSERAIGRLKEQCVSGEKELGEKHIVNTI
jgi:endonuclease III